MADAPTATDDNAPDQLDAEAVAKSVNGFDQIAIRQHFRMRFDQIADDALMLQRALLFVVNRRAGMSDADAFRDVMLQTIDEISDRFAAPEDAGLDDEDPDAVAERDNAWADFVIATGLSYTVDEFTALTLHQRDAIRDALVRSRG